jgi:glycosyltransferase involved in cell wall biosynthesis
VTAFLTLRQHGRIPGLRLHVGGSCGPSDARFVEELKRRLAAAGALGDVEFHPNLEHGAKQDFLRGLSVFSVPAHYGEAFGLYLIEAMAAGVPVVQPRTAAFPELVEDTGGGVLCERDDANSLARSIEEVLTTPGLAQRLGQAGRAAVEQRYHSDAVAEHLLTLFRACCEPKTRVVA